jgi:hypothetical protein
MNGEGGISFFRKFSHCGNKEFWENKFTVNSRKNLLKFCQIFKSTKRKEKKRKTPFMVVF